MPLTIPLGRAVKVIIRLRPNAASASKNIQQKKHAINQEDAAVLLQVCVLNFINRCRCKKRDAAYIIQQRWRACVRRRSSSISYGHGQRHPRPLDFEGAIFHVNKIHGVQQNELCVIRS